MSRFVESRLLALMLSSGIDIEGMLRMSGIRAVESRRPRAESGIVIRGISRSGGCVPVPGIFIPGGTRDLVESSATGIDMPLIVSVAMRFGRTRT